MNDFISHFTAAITANPDVEPELAKQCMAIINGPRSIKRTLILRALERHARQQVAETHGFDIEAIDWSKVDWMKVLGTILRILLLFAPLVLGS